MRATFQFTDPVPGIIHKLKYQGQFALAKPLGELMAESWPSWRAPAELVMSIPLHPKRKKYRGYNQSELLARHLCHALDLPGDSRALRRMRNTRPQIDLSPTDRVTNVAGAFWADGEKVAGKAILLIDDVCTTGSTLSEAAKALLTAGATTVSAYCLARVVEE
jgi:ComF family protein